MNNDQRDGQNRFLANSPPATEANRGKPGVGGGLGKLNGFNNNRLTGFPDNNDQSNQNLNLLSSSIGSGAGRFKGGNNDFAELPRGKFPPLIHSTTAIPLGVTRTTSTRRPKPHVKSNVRLANKNRNKNKGVKEFLPLLPPSDAPPPSPEIFQEIITDDRSTDPFRNPPVLSADGRKPRVKSNLKKNRNKKFKNKFNNGGGKKHGNRVSVNTENIRFVDPGINDIKESPRNNAIGNKGNSFFSGPEVRPDGRPPRVKSNLRAKNKGKKKKNGRPVFTTENPFSSFFSPSSQRPAPPSTSPPSVPDFFQNFLTSTPQPPFSNSIAPNDEAPIVSDVSFEVEEYDYYEGSGNFVSSTRPPFVSSTRRPIVSSTGRPSVSSTRRPFVSSTRRPFVSSTRAPSRPSGRPSFNNVRPTSRFSSKRPKVKSDIIAANRNRERNRNQNRFQGNRNKFNDAVRFENESPRTNLNQQKFFQSTTDRSNINRIPQIPVKTSIPEDVVEYVDEIDEFVAPTTTTTRRPSRVRTRPRVKSNLKVRQRNRPKKNKSRNRNKVNLSKKVKFTSNSINSIEDDTCDNPFKCPPTKAAPRPDGRRPRVKSNIKARRRNYYRPSIRKTNRIKGRPKPKKSRFRGNGNQFKTRLKTRKGKSQRQKAFTKTPTSTPPSPAENEFLQSDVKPSRFFPTTTENVLSLFLNQIENENEGRFRDQPPIESDNFAPPLVSSPRPSRPSSRPFIQQIPLEQQSFNDGSFRRPGAGNQKDNRAPFPSFPTVQTNVFDDSVEEVPQTRFPPRNRPSPVTHSAPPLPTVPSLAGVSSSAVFPQRPSSFSSDINLSSGPSPSQNSFNLPISSPTQPAFFPTISQPLSVFVNNNDVRDPIESDYSYDYSDETVPVVTTTTATTTTTRRTTTRKVPEVKSTRFSFSNFDFNNKDRRKPKVKSNILQAIRNKGKNRKFKEGFRSNNGFRTNLKFINNDDKESSNNDESNLADNSPNIVERSTISSVPSNQLNEDGTSRKIDVIFTNTDIDAKPSVRPDGRKPRVKSNIRAKHARKGKSLTKHKVDIDPLFSGSGGQNVRVGKSVVSFDDTTNVLDYDTEPEVRPDGQKPRVKSNILAAAKLKAIRHKTSEGLQGQHSFKHSKKVLTTSRPKFLQALLFNNGKSNTNESIPLNNSDSLEPSERALVIHQTTTPPSTTTSKGSISSSTTPTVITTTSRGNTQSPFGSTVPSILGAFLNTLNTRAIDPTLSSQLQEANGQQNNKNFQRFEKYISKLKFYNHFKII